VNGGILVPRTAWISEQAQEWIDRFVSDLEAKEDLSPKTLKEYASDLRHLADWFEATWNSHSEEETLFHPAVIATKTLIRYREYMQLNQHLKPATINRRLNTVKRFFDWAQQTGVVKIDVADPVKLVPEEKTSPRQMTDKEEADLVAAVQQHGSLRDRTIILLMLHTGLRTMEVCNLKPEDVTIGKRSGTLVVRSGKRQVSETNSGRCR